MNEQMNEQMKARIVETPQAEMMHALDDAAWRVDTAEGRIPGVGYVQIDRVGQRRSYRLDGREVTGRSIYRKARSASAEAFRIAQNGC